MNKICLLLISLIAGMLLWTGCMEFEDDGVDSRSSVIVPDTVISAVSCPITVDLMEGKSAAILIAGVTVQFVEVLGSDYVEENGNWVPNYTCLLNFDGAGGLQSMEMNTHADPSECRFGNDPYYVIKLTDVTYTGEGYRLRLVVTEHPRGGTL